MNGTPQIFAHRGARAVAPENTLPAFEAALEMGVDGIELDVHCSKDGQLVVIHDFDVDRTTNASGPVSAFTAAELSQLDAGSSFDVKYAGAGIPSLANVLDLIGDRCRINIEIKSVDPFGGDPVEPLAEMIQRRNLYEQIIVSSFNPITLIKMRWVDRDIALGFLYGEGLPCFLHHAWTGPVIQPQALHPVYKVVDTAAVDWAKKRGFAINTWTVNDLDEARRLADLGVDTVISDVPDQLMRALRSPADGQ